MTGAEKKKLASAKFDFIDAVSLDRRLSLLALAVFIRLIQHRDDEAGSSYIAQSDIASELGRSTRQVKDAVAELVECGWVAIRRRGRRNFYVFKWVPKEKRADAGEGRRKRRRQGQQSANREGRKIAPDANREGRKIAPAVSSLRTPIGEHTDSLRSRQQAAESMPVARKRVKAKMGFRDILRTTGIAEHNLQHVVESLISMGRKLTPGLGWRLRGDILRIRREYGSTDDQIVMAMVELGWAVIGEDQEDRFVDAMPDADDAAEMVRAAA